MRASPLFRSNIKMSSTSLALSCSVCNARLDGNVQLRETQKNVKKVKKWSLHMHTHTYTVSAVAAVAAATAGGAWAPGPGADSVGPPTWQPEAEPPTHHSTAQGNVPAAPKVPKEHLDLRIGTLRKMGMPGGRGGGGRTSHLPLMGVRGFPHSPPPTCLPEVMGGGGQFGVRNPSSLGRGNGVNTHHGGGPNLSSP